MEATSVEISVARVIYSNGPEAAVPVSSLPTFGSGWSGRLAVTGVNKNRLHGLSQWQLKSA